MAPSPSKGKGLHKSSGKFLRRKDHEASKSSAGNHSINGSSNNGSSRRDDISGSHSNGGFSPHSSVELKESHLSLPVMYAIDHTKNLPRYNNLRSGEKLSMEELDNLQLELELLASSMLVRQSAITSQLAVVEHLEKGKPPPKPPSIGVKRLRTSDLNDGPRPSKKSKDNNSKARDVPTLPPIPSSATPPPPPSKVKCSIIGNAPHFDVPDLPHAEAPRPPPPRNDIINKFWSFVDTYCQEITADDIKMLEDMIAAHNDDPEVYKVQPLGKHYSLRWAQEDLLDEQKDKNKLTESSNGTKKKTSNGTDVSDKLLREVDMNHGSSDDTTPLGPLTQRLLAGLVDEKSRVLAENSENKGVGVGRPGFLRSLGLGSGAGLEKRLKKELQDHGLIDPDTPGQEDDDDEIAQELRRCQAELRTVSSHNLGQLNRLLGLARDALYRHDLKKKLRDSEAKVIEAYKNINALRVKKKQLSKKDKDAAWKAIKEREAIVKQLDSLTA